jgi:hypothetical protein
MPRPPLLIGLLWAALSAVQSVEHADRYQELCAGHLQPSTWDEDEDGTWIPPENSEWKAHPLCPEMLTADSFRSKCQMDLTPIGWDEEEDGVFQPPPDLALPTCIFIFVPHILDTGAKGRMEALGTVMDMVAKDKDKPLVYFWAEAGAQPAFEEALNVGGLYPKLSLYSPRLKMGASMHNAFTTANIQSFLRKVAVSQLAVRPVLVGIEDVTSPEPWDGLDGEAQTCTDDLAEYDDIVLDSEI